ncbi:MAG: hypothetical protein IKT35_02740, partial [Clostridia bacterium]|nr:hypothetical protein [Clostridia bacterium]
MIEKGEDIILEGLNGVAVVSKAKGENSDEFIITVSLGENTALGCYRAVLKYDETALQLVEMTEGDFCSAVNKANGKANGFATEDVTEGTLFSATFKALVEDGDFEVDVDFEIATNVETEPVTMHIMKADCAHDELSEIKYDENNHWYECLIGCGNIVNVAPHEGGEATCSAKAVCTVCGAEYGEKDANNHVGGTENRNAVAADCGNGGYTGDTYCLGCNAKIASGEVIPATGEHTWNDGEVTTAPTCVAEGVKTYTCSVCQGTKTESIPATGNHTWNDGEVTTAPTCG